MNKPIEVGCLVMLKNVRDGFEDGVGSSGVVVAKHFNKGSGIHIRQGGKIVASFDCDFIWQAETADGNIYAETHALLRIDDYDASQDEVTECQTLTA